MFFNLVIQKSKSTTYKHFRLNSIPSFTAFWAYIVPYDIYLYGNICYFNNFDRTWEFILIQLVLESSNLSLLMRFKLYNFVQIDIYFKKF